MYEKEIDNWIEIAKRQKCDYILIVSNKTNVYPLYCLIFDDLHIKYHECNENHLDVLEIVEIYHDGSVERNIEIHNLL